MKRITTFIIFLVLCADCLAQTPEQTVRQYVSLLNEWLASPYSADKQKNVLNILNGGESAMKDEIVENFNSDAGKKHTSPGNYLAIFYEKTTANRVKVEIVSLKAKTDDTRQFVTTVLKYSGGISLTTAADFWISGGKITGIVSNEWEIAKLRSSASQNQPAVTPPVQNNTNVTPSIVQQPSVSENEHEWVDLGLPSGTLWATCNVGANNPWEYGDYFAWGETTTKSTYSWSNYKHGNGIDYNVKKKYNKNDHKTTLEKKDDVANQKWGEYWCMPTQVQFKELKDKCTWTWTSRNGKNGYEITGPNNNTIFLPAAGCHIGNDLYDVGSSGNYWSTSIYAGIPNTARDLNFNSDNVYADSNNDRRFGYSVRPVRSKN